MRELQPGLWHWEAPHPQWEGSVQRGQAVSSYATDDGERLLLFDPLAPPGDIVELAARRETAIVLTCPWHERDSQSLVERLGVAVYTPLPDTAEYLMQKWGLTAEQAADGVGDALLLVVGGHDHVEAQRRAGGGGRRPKRQAGEGREVDRGRQHGQREERQGQAPPAHRPRDYPVRLIGPTNRAVCGRATGC